MRKFLDFVCIFGFSPHLPQIVDFCESCDITCFLVFGSRQRDAIDSLNLPKTAQKLCIQGLDDSSYQKLRIREHNSLGFSFGSPFIFTQKDIDDFCGQLINSHGAPLPEFKGGGGFSWRILQRDKRGAILMHYVTTKIDEGACVFHKAFSFSDDERTPGALEKRQLKEELNYLVPWIKQVISGQAQLTELAIKSLWESQLDSYFPRLCTDLHGYIDWSLPVQDLESFVLAFSSPYDGASTFVKGVKVRIMDCCLHHQCSMHPFTYGLVIREKAESILVACNGGIISIRHDNLRIEGNVCTINVGQRFFTPLSSLEKALSTRAFYKPDGIVLKDYAADQLP